MHAFSERWHDTTKCAVHSYGLKWSIPIQRYSPCITMAWSGPYQFSACISKSVFLIFYFNTAAQDTANFVSDCGSRFGHLCFPVIFILAHFLVALVVSRLSSSLCGYPLVTWLFSHTKNSFSARPDITPLGYGVQCPLDTTCVQGFPKLQRWYHARRHTSLHLRRCNHVRMLWLHFRRYWRPVWHDANTNRREAIRVTS